LTVRPRPTTIDAADSASVWNSSRTLHAGCDAFSPLGPQSSDVTAPPDALSDDVSTRATARSRSGPTTVLFSSVDATVVHEHTPGDVTPVSTPSTCRRTSTEIATAPIDKTVVTTESTTHTRALARRRASCTCCRSCMCWCCAGSGSGATARIGGRKRGGPGSDSDADESPVAPRPLASNSIDSVRASSAGSRVRAATLGSAAGAAGHADTRSASRPPPPPARLPCRSPTM
jgi:hypothetical protein